MKVGVSLAAAEDVVDESSVHVAENVESECFCDDSRIYRSFGVFDSVGLAMGHSVLLHYFSQFGDGVMGH